MNKKKYYLIYQVTNNVNGKIYIGMHETNDLEDDYMGSGLALNRAKEKYGLENFTFKVLMYLFKDSTTNNPEYINQKIEFLRFRYSYYLEFGFDMMKAKFDYPYSFPNFSSSCKKYLPEYQKNKRYNIIAKKNGSI